jgi:hypothetical protein
LQYKSVLDTWQLVQAVTNVRSGHAKRGERVAMCSALEQVLRYMDIRVGQEWHEANVLF